MRLGFVPAVLVPTLFVVALLCLDRCRESSVSNRQSPAAPGHDALLKPAPLAIREGAGPFRPSRAPSPVPLEPLGARLARLLDQDSQTPRLASHQLADFIASHNSDAFSLVAAFEATLDPEFLKQAAAAHPTNPLVQARVLAHNLFPKQRANWIAALKKASSDNSLPYLFAAVDAMERGDPETALAELRSTASKTFNDFSREGMIGLEEAYLAAGHTAEEALALSHSEMNLPALAPFKKLGSQLADLAVERARAWDQAAQTRLLEGAWQSGSQLRQSGSQGMLITDLVGLALQNMALQRWPENVPAPFLDGPVSARLEQNQSFRSSVRATSGVFHQWLPNASEQEIGAYYKRLRLIGESKAMDWLNSQHPELAAR